MSGQANPRADAAQHALNGYWNGRAGAYHRTHVASARGRAEAQLWREIFARALQDVEPGATVYDMGCGSGFLTHILADLGFAAVGIDAAGAMVGRARKTSARRAGAGLPAARFVCADATIAHRLPLAPGAAVVSKWVLWTLPDPVGALGAWARLAPRVIAADALWYPDGITPAMRVDSTLGEDAFARTYGTLRLPLAEGASLEDYARAFQAAGLDPQVTALDGPARLERQFGLAPGHAEVEHFLIAAAAAG